MREIRTSGSTRGEERQPLPLLLYRHPRHLGVIRKAAELELRLCASPPTLRRHVERVVAAVNAATPGSYAEVDIPFN